MPKVVEPFPIFYDDDGLALENGQIYIGVANQDPRQNPIQLYWDSGRTIPATQPIRTLGGRPSYQGAPANVYMAENSYSIGVFNSFGTPVTADQNTSPFLTVAEGSRPAPVKTIAATSYTLLADDAGYVLRFTASTNVTLNIAAGLGMLTGSGIEIWQEGTGQIIPTAGGGVTIRVAGALTKTRTQYSAGGLRVLGTDLYGFAGDLA